MEPVEAPAIANELRPFLFEDPPDRLLGPLRIGVGLRPAQTFAEQPAAQMRSALPYWASILRKKARNIALSAVFPGSTS